MIDNRFPTNPEHTKNRYFQTFRISREVYMKTKLPCQENKSPRNNRILTIVFTDDNL